MAKKLISILLTLCILMSCVAIGTFSTQAATSASGIDYGLVDNIQYGNILHCWNWSVNNIRRNLPKIAEQGFTAVQTSPLQLMKESLHESWSTVSNSWWAVYQPIGFTVDNRGWGLGSPSELQALCNEAHQYNIKVIVDVVFNHLANDYTGGTINPQVDADLREDSSAWHSPLNYEISDYSNRYDVTHYSLTGLPDLNTGSSKVQWYASSYLKELIYLGVDGFRFDAAKHIETPTDAYGTSSEFWYNVLSEATSYANSTRGFTPFYYGEILDTCLGLDIGAYTYYMSITDNGWSEAIRNGVLNTDSGAAASTTSHNGAAGDRIILWNESHDEYATTENYTRTISDWSIRKVWGISGSKNQSAGLYLARPNDWSSTMVGEADETGWASVEVQAINQFKNYFAGQSEYMASYGNFAYNMRGNSGCVIVDTGGGSNSWASVPTNGTLAAGTYKDQISGNTFTVGDDGWLYGQMGQSGISVIYNKGPEVSVTPGTKAYRTDTLTLTMYIQDADHGRYSLDGYNYTDFSNGTQITIGADKAVGETQMVYVQSVNMWGQYSNVETYAYWKQDPNQVQELFFDKSKTDWGDVYAYIYDKDTGSYATAWPGIKMSLDDNTDLMYCDVPKGYENAWVIFNDNGYHQSPENGYGYKLNAETQIWYNDDVLHSYSAPKTEGLSGDLYLYTNNWGNDDAVLKAYVWTGGNSGTATFTSIGNCVYKATLPSGAWKHLKVLRVNPNGTGSSDWENLWGESPSQMIPTGCNMFSMYDDSWDGSGTWSSYSDSTTETTEATTESTSASTSATTEATTASTTASTSATTEATETVTSDYYLSGSFNEWSETATPLVVSGTTATTTVTLEAGTYEFKVIDNGTWYGYNSTISDSTSTSGVTMRSSANNATLSATGGTYTFKYNTSTRKLVVSYSATATEATEATTASTAATTASTAPTTVTTAPTTASTSAVTSNYYLSGSFNEWSETATPLVVSGTTATTTVTLEAGTYEFKVIDNGTWYGYNSTISDSTSTSGVTMRSSANNATLSATGGTYTFKYNTSTRKLVVSYSAVTTEPTEAATEATTASSTSSGYQQDTTNTTASTSATTEATEVTTAASTSKYYLTGSFNDWSSTATPLTVSSKTASATVTLDAGTYEFKVVDNGTEYGYSRAISNKTSTSGVTMRSTAGNCTLTASGGTYTFKYNTSTKKLVISYSSGSNNGWSGDETIPGGENGKEEEVIATESTVTHNKCASGHTYNKGTVTKKATYVSEGKKVQTCSECGKTKTVTIAKLKLKKPTVKITAGSKKITVKYSKVKNATGYQVRYTYKGKTYTKTYKTQKAATKMIKNLKKGSYKVKVRAFIKQNGKTAYSGWTKAKTVKVK